MSSNVAKENSPNIQTEQPTFAAKSQSGRITIVGNCLAASKFYLVRSRRSIMVGVGLFIVFLIAVIPARLLWEICLHIAYSLTNGKHWLVTLPIFLTFVFGVAALCYGLDGFKFKVVDGPTGILEWGVLYCAVVAVFTSVVVGLQIFFVKAGVMQEPSWGSARGG